LIKKPRVFLIRWTLSSSCAYQINQPNISLTVINLNYVIWLKQGKIANYASSIWTFNKVYSHNTQATPFC
jgi:hypothetical protein